MDETYEIVFEGAPVGTVKRQRQGLYCRFCCRCRLPDEGLYRIHAICGEIREDLGICVPMDGGFGMDKKIPAKRLGEGDLSFELVPRDWKPTAVLTPEPEAETPQAVDTGAEEEKPLSMEQEVHADFPEPGEPQFALEPEEPQRIPESGGPQFIPVSQDEPFGHLDQLEGAVFTQQEGQPGVLLRDTTDEPLGESL